MIMQKLKPLSTEYCLHWLIVLVVLCNSSRTTLVRANASGETLALATGSPPRDAHSQIALEYDQIFADDGKEMLPTQTLAALERLKALMLQAGYSAEAKTVDFLIQISHLSPHCEISDARRIGYALSTYPEQGSRSVQAYVKNCRDKMFATCKPILAKQSVEAVASIGNNAKIGQLERFKELVANSYSFPLPQKFLLRESAPIKDALIEYAREQNDGKRFKTKWTNRNNRKQTTQFERQFKPLIDEVCKEIRGQFDFFAHFQPIFMADRYLVEQIDKSVVDWLKAWNVCVELKGGPERDLFVKEIFDYLAKKRASRLLFKWLQQRLNTKKAAKAMSH